MKTVEIYPTRTCPYCIAAKGLLTKKSVPFTEIDVGADPALRQTMTARADGRRSVPQVFIDGKGIGGWGGVFGVGKGGKLGGMFG